MSSQSNWADLAPRVASGIMMALGGAAFVLLGGWTFVIGVSALCGVMLWETAKMYNAPGAVGPAILGAIVVGLSATVLPGMVTVPALLAAALVAASRLKKDQGTVMLFSAWVLIGCYAFLTVGIWLGLYGLAWLILVVIASDVAGYFAGRILGGPKFWPQISPKKTWSGTIAGWIGAAIVGALFMGHVPGGAALIGVSVLVAFAGQLGDIAESAIKRRAGAKDSSDLIPGHGGVLDRFDAMLGAAVLVMVLLKTGLVFGAA